MGRAATADPYFEILPSTAIDKKSGKANKNPSMLLCPISRSLSTDSAARLIGSSVRKYPSTTAAQALLLGSYSLDRFRHARYKYNGLCGVFFVRVRIIRGYTGVLNWLMHSCL